MSERFHAAPVQPAPKRHAAEVGLPVVDDGIPRPIHHDLSVAIAHLFPCVSKVPVEAAVGAEEERVGGMVVLAAAGVGKERLFLFGHVVAVRVGEDPDVGRAGDDHLVAQDADPHRRVDVTPLVEDFLDVRNAVPVRVLEDQDPVAFRPLAFVVAVVDHLADPDSAAGVNVNIGRGDDLRLGGEERRFKPLRYVQIRNGTRRIPNVGDWLRARRRFGLRPLLRLASGSKQDSQQNVSDCFSHVIP